MIDRCIVSVARIVRPRLLGLAFILAAGLAAFAGASLVAAQRGDPVEPLAPAAYQGCASNLTGALRIVGDGVTCLNHETAIELGSSGEDSALQERIEALEEDNASQKSLIESLQQENGAQADTIAALQAQVPDCLSASGNEVYFTGCNVNIRNGNAGLTTENTNGLGNLIVGYNEDNGNARTGSHNLVIGQHHNYTSYGGLVAGRGHELTGKYSALIGGQFNVASGDYSSVTGGSQNTASGDTSVVGGGQSNTADGLYTVVSAGGENIASGPLSSIGGGWQNTATGYVSSVGGGTGVHNDLQYTFLP